MSENTRTKIQKILFQDFGLETSYQEGFFSSSLLDSMDILKLVVKLQEAFDIQISSFEVSLEAFDNLNSIEAFIHRKLEQHVS